MRVQGIAVDIHITNNDCRSSSGKSDRNEPIYSSNGMGVIQIDILVEGRVNKWCSLMA